MEDCFAVQHRERESQENDIVSDCKHQRASSCSTTFSESSSDDTYFSNMNKLSDFDQTSQNPRYNFKKTQIRFVSLTEDKEKSLVDPEVIKTSKKQKTRHQDKLFSNDISQLQDIEKRTQNLVLKEKEQRKQLKKMKKMYDAHIQEYQKLKNQYESDTEGLHLKLDDFMKKELTMQEEAQNLQNNIRELETDLKTVQRQLERQKAEKEGLWRRIELMDANCECRFHQKEQKNEIYDSRVQEIIGTNESVEDLRKQMEVIDQQIEKKSIKAEKQADFKEIISLYEFRKNYNNKIEELLIDKERKKSQRVIFKLNRIIVNSNRKLQSGKGVSQEVNLSPKDMVESIIYIEDDKDKGAQTSDSFFGGQMEESKYNQTVETWSNCLQTNAQDDAEAGWSQLKAQISNLIQEKSLEGFEEVYENIEELTIGLLDLFETKAESHQFMNLVERTMESTNDFFQSKARKQCQTISRLMQIVNSKSCNGSEINKTGEPI